MSIAAFLDDVFPKGYISSTIVSILLPFGNYYSRADAFRHKLDAMSEHLVRTDWQPGLTWWIQIIILDNVVYCKTLWEVHRSCGAY